MDLSRLRDDRIADVLDENEFSDAESLFQDDTDEDPNFEHEEISDNSDTDSDGSNEAAVPNQPRPNPAALPNQGWTEADLVPNIDVFCGEHGLTDIPELDGDSSVLDFFQYFIDKDLLSHFKEQTNLYAQQTLRKLRAANKLTPNSRMNKWKTVTLAELKKFLAIIFHMSINQKPKISDHWSQDPVVSCNFCPNLMSRDRFMLIMANFHINDNRLSKKKGEPGYDSLHKVRPLLETLRLRFQRAYLPNENITIDEGMCKFRGRLYFKQYMPQKPSKYGIKLYMLSESSSGYVWNFEVFSGDSSTVVRLVTNLLGTLLGSGRTLFTDRFYTSPTLAEELETQKIGVVGTTMKNRKGIPQVIKQARLKKGEQIFRRKGNILALRWKDKRDVFMISSRHTAQMITYQDRFDREKTKPACVVNYNQNKFGVDLADQRMSYGAFDHRSVKWWRKLAFHMFLMSLVNACILCNKICNKQLSTTQFIKQLCTELSVVEQEEPRPSSSGHHLSRLATGKHFLEKIPVPPGKTKVQRMCKVCSARGTRESGKAKRKDTSYWCCECQVPLCKDPCFKVYHTKKNFKV